MRNVKGKLWRWSVAALLCFAHGAFAGQVQMKLTDAGGNIAGGVYVNPYTGTIDGVSAQIICDDFSAHTPLNQTWTAEEYNFSTLGSTSNTSKYLSGKTATEITQYYSAASWLAFQLLAEPLAARRAELSFAIWGVFDPSSISYLGNTSNCASNPNTSACRAANLRDTAFNRTYTSAEQTQFASSVSIYSPVTGFSSGLPQEFLVVKTPEPAALALLGLDLSAVGALVLFLRRNKASSN